MPDEREEVTAEDICEEAGVKDTHGIITALVAAGFDDLAVRRVETIEQAEIRENKRLAAIRDSRTGPKVRPETEWSDDGQAEE